MHTIILFSNKLLYFSGSSLRAVFPFICLYQSFWFVYLRRSGQGTEGSEFENYLRVFNW